MLKKIFHITNVHAREHIGHLYERMYGETHDTYMLHIWLLYESFICTYVKHIFNLEG